MAIRDLQSSDLDALLGLYAHLRAADDRRPEPTAIQAIWREIMANPCYRHFGVHDGQRLISTCTLAVIANLTRGCRPYGLIENVVTHPDFRDRGHGTAVLAHAVNQAWSQRCYKVMLLTGRTDEARLCASMKAPASIGEASRGSSPGLRRDP